MKWSQEWSWETNPPRLDLGDWSGGGAFGLEQDELLAVGDGMVLMPAGRWRYSPAAACARGEASTAADAAGRAWVSLALYSSNGVCEDERGADHSTAGLTKRNGTQSFSSQLRPQSKLQGASRAALRAPFHAARGLVLLKIKQKVIIRVAE